MTASAGAPVRPPGLVGRAIGHPVARILLSVAIVQGSLFVSGILVVRAIGIEQRGELALLSGVVGIASQVGLTGLPAAIVFYVASRRITARRLFGVIRGTLARRLIIFSVLAVAALLVLGVVSQPLSHPVGEALLTFVGVALLMVGFTVLAGLQGEQRFTAFTILQALPILLYAVVVAVLFATGTGSMLSFLAANTGGWLLALLLTLALLRQRPPQGDPGEVPSGGEVRRFGVRAWIAAAAPTDLLGIDQVLIGAVLGHAPLGLYVIGWAFETGTVLPGTALANFLGPRVAAAPVEAQRRLALRWALGTFLAAVAVCLVLEAVIGQLIVIAFGEEARDATAPARVLLVGGVLLGLRRVLAVALQGVGRPQWSTLAELAAFATMMIGVVALGLLFGVIGSAYGMTLAGLVGVLAQVVMFLRLPPVRG